MRVGKITSSASRSNPRDSAALDEEHCTVRVAILGEDYSCAEQCELSVPGCCDSHSLAFLFFFLLLDHTQILLHFTGQDFFFFYDLFRFLPIWEFPHSGVFFGFVSSPSARVGGFPFLCARILSSFPQDLFFFGVIFP